MANVCQCDACGTVAPYKQCMRLRICTFDTHGAENAARRILDVCPACSSKLRELLKLGVKKDND